MVWEVQSAHVLVLTFCEPWRLEIREELLQVATLSV